MSESASEHKFYLAPLRGITDRIFRETYERHFGRFDFLLAPFVPTIKGMRVRDHHITDVIPNGFNDPKRLIPQIIGHDTDGFLLLCHRFEELGFTSVNWNLGCPAPLITKKKRGSGLLPHKDIIKMFLDGVIPKTPIPLSVKTRLGLNNNDELETLIPIFNDYPLKELIIHPRTGSQLYGGAADLGKFETCSRMSKHKVVYNGDICSADDLKYLSMRFPDVNRWMIGRGVIKNPNLLNELKTGAPSSAVFTRSIKSFLDDLLNVGKDLAGQTRTLGRMKGVWRYLGAGVGERCALTEKIMRCETLGEYESIINTL